MKSTDRHIPLCVGLGEVLFDVGPSGKRLGGAPANFAYVCRALGMKAAVVSAVGDDELGRQAERELAHKALPAILPRVAKETGHVDVAFHDGGIPSYHFSKAPAYEHIPYTADMKRLAGEADICSFGTLAQRGTETAETVRQFLQDMREETIRIFDVNLRDGFADPSVIDRSLSLATAVKCNEEELPLLCRLAGISHPDSSAYWSYLKGRGISCFLYTEGEKKSTIWLHDRCSVVPSPAIDAVDTVGAGDSFAAAFSSALFMGASLEEAHQKAVTVSAFLCTMAGGMPDFPETLRL